MDDAAATAEAFVAALRSADEQTRYAAAFALAEQGDRRALPVVQEALDSADETVRWQADRALGKLSEATARRAHTAKVLEECRHFLESPSGDARGEAARMLADLDDPQAQALLEGLLEDPEPFVQLNAAKALLRSGYERAFGVLLHLLRDSPHPAVHVMTAAALEGLRDPRAIEPLAQRLLQSDHIGARRSFARTLAEMNDPRIIEPLIKALVTDIDWHTRCNAAHGLWKIGESAQPYLLPLLESEDVTVRVLAAWVLGHLGADAAFQILVEALGEKPWVVSLALSGLVRSGDPCALDVLINVLETANHVGTRSTAAYLLGEIGDPRAEQPLRARLDDTEERVRRNATEAIAKIKTRTSPRLA